MEIKITTQHILKIIYALAWIIFIGICIDLGGFIFNTFFSLFINPEGAQHFWKETNLAALLKNSTSHFVSITSLMIIATALKALLFYLIVKLLHDKKLSLAQPFNKDVCRFIFNFMYITFGIGLFSLWGSNYTKWLLSLDIPMPSLEELKFGGANVWLFMGVVLLVLAQIFKRGIEIQEENELTI